MKKIIILGSTGSIGRQTLDVIRQNPHEFDVFGLAVGSNTSLLNEQIAEFNPEVVAVGDPESASLLDDLTQIQVLSGVDGVCELAGLLSDSMVVSAIAGFSGVRPTLAACESGSDIALANKESVVCAGESLISRVRKNDSRLIPVDSEHSAIFQCLQGEDSEHVDRLILTASGGPFFGASSAELEQVTASEALDHPNWDMGDKITIDSATLMNKGLEIIEARWLFNLDYEHIDVLVHPQSIVHSMVEYTDGTIKAELGPPDMRYAIQYALSFPGRWKDPGYADFSLIDNTLEFYAPDIETFRCLHLARQAGVEGGVFPTFLVSADDVAVEAFLAGKIGFVQIAEIIESVLNDCPAELMYQDLTGDAEQIETFITCAAQWARRRAHQLVDENQS